MYLIMSESPESFLTDETFEYARPGQWPVMQSLERYIDQPPENVRGYVVAPTGSGKTVIFSRLLEDLRSVDNFPRTLVVTSRSLLVDQTRADLVHNGFGGSVGTVKGWKEDIGEGDVRVITYNGFAKQINQPYGRAINPNLYGLVILDEAHHLQGPQVQKALRQFGHAMWIGFTASPDYDEARQLKHVLPDLIHEVTIREAVIERLIAPYINALFMTEADLSDVKVVNGDFRRVELDRAINTELRNRRIAEFYVDNMVGERTIFNTSTVEHAEAMAKILAEFDVPSASVHGGVARGKRRELLGAFATGEILALTQARLLSEGYNQPLLGNTINLSPTLSKVWAIQRAGRGQRINPADSDKVSVIIDCVDKNYRRVPLLYGSDKVSEAWWAIPPEMRPQAAEVARRLGEYCYRGLELIVDPRKAQETYESLQPYSYIGNGSQNIDEKEAPTRAFDILDDLESDSQHELLLGILDETYTLPDSASREDITTVLRLIAGSSELGDSDILKRYQILNAALTQNPEQTFIRLTVRQVEGRHNYKLPRPRK